VIFVFGLFIFVIPFSRQRSAVSMCAVPGGRVVDPAGKNRAWPFSLQLSAKLEEFDEVGHRPFRVLSVGGEIGEALLDPGDGGFDCRYQPLCGQVFRRGRWNGLFVLDRNFAGGVGADRRGIL
jgi:hypothetical protein